MAPKPGTLGLASFQQTVLQALHNPCPDMSTWVRKPSHASSDLESFKKYLLIRKRRNVNQTICYATKYGYILRTGNASELLTASSNKRRHSMEALTCLPKFLGCYYAWKSIWEHYEIERSDDSSIDFFEEIYMHPRTTARK
jgi:hypothetical protein